MKLSRMIRRCFGVVFGTKVVRLCGCDVSLTWPFNVYVFLFSLWMGLTENWWFMLVTPVALSIVYLNVLIHEYGHVFAARWLGYDCKDIAILPVGGAAFITGDWQQKPLHEAIIALAGPAVNAALGIIHLCIDFFLPESGPLKALNEAMLLLNAVMVFFNLLPVFPMDGGRLLRASLAYFFGCERGTAVTRLVSAFAGTFCAVIAVYFGYYFAAVLLTLVPAISFLEPKAKREVEEMQKALKSGDDDSLREKGLIVVKPGEYKSQAG